MIKKILSVKNNSSSKPDIALFDSEDCSFSLGTTQSPIFKLSESEGMEDISDGYILFLYVPFLFEYLGKIFNLPDENSNELWISNGLANLILISADREKVISFKDDINKDGKISAYELWEVNDGKISSRKYEVFSSVSKTVQNTLIDITGLNHEHTFLAKEFCSGIRACIERSELYSPYSTEHYNRSLVKGIEIVNNIKETSDSVEKHNRKEDEDKLASFVSDLVEMNSVLAYSLTQGLVGVPPLLQNPAVIQSYSLLGIGTSYQGYLAVYLHVHKVFEAYSIESILTKHFSEGSGFAIGHETSNCLKNLKGDETDDSLNHLVYFSGRLGFRESLNSISASLFCLVKGSTNRWNLLTFSHEYIHAHLRALLSKILTPENAETTEEVDSHIGSLVDAFNVYNTDRSKYQNEYSKLECLGFSIINYYQILTEIQQHQLRKEKKKPSSIRIGEKPVDKEWFIKTLKQGDRWSMLNEIIVHTLDYHYFYNGRNDLYISVLWESWSTVPQVRGSLHNYIMRTLVALCSKVSTGNKFDQRFLIALREFKDELEVLVSKKRGTKLIDEALMYIGESNNVVALKESMICSVELIDDVMAVLHHPDIHADLMTDPLTSADNIYPIERGDFDGVKITSPIAFLQDQVRQNLDSHDVINDVSNEYLSLWSSLACISSLDD